MEINDKFMNVYANLPLSQRNEIIVVIDDEPLTWNAARVEVETGSQKGNEILKKLKKMDILQ